MKNTKDEIALTRENGGEGRQCTAEPLNVDTLKIRTFCHIVLSPSCLKSGHLTPSRFSFGGSTIKRKARRKRRSKVKQEVKKASHSDARGSR